MARILHSARVTARRLSVYLFRKIRHRRRRLYKSLGQPVKYFGGTRKTYELYWGLYGGRREFLRSPYLYAACFFGLITSNLADQKNGKQWFEIAISILPNLLGLTMGGMAITLSFVSISNFPILSANGRDDSFFMKIVANYFHVVLVQVVALFFAIFSYSRHDCIIINMIGHVIFLYALFLSLATAGQVLNVARLMNKISVRKRSEHDHSVPPASETR